MSRGLLNWTAGEVIRFLRDNKFRHDHTRGSHFYYVGMAGGKLRMVCVPVHGSQSIKPRTLKGIIDQSCIPKDKWLNQN